MHIERIVNNIIIVLGVYILIKIFLFVKKGEGNNKFILPWITFGIITLACGIMIRPSRIGAILDTKTFIVISILAFVGINFVWQISSIAYDSERRVKLLISEIAILDYTIKKQQSKIIELEHKIKELTDNRK